MIAWLGRTRAPWVAALLGFAVAAAFALTADLRLAASVTDFAVYAIFVVVNLAVIVLRRSEPGLPRTIVVPGSYRHVPLLPLAAIGTVLVMLARLGVNAWFFGGIALAVGAAVWLLLRVPGRNRRVESLP
jgi:basic amino acid/polyamine antiporter, APA family